MSAPVDGSVANTSLASSTTVTPAETPPERRHIVGFDERPSRCFTCRRVVESRQQWVTEDCYIGGPTKIERLRDRMFALFFEHVPGERRTKMLAARALLREAPSAPAHRALESYLDSIEHVFFGSRHPK